MNKDSILDELITEAKRLDLFRLSQEQALIWAYKVFEDSVRLTTIKIGKVTHDTEGMAREGMDALNILVRWIFEFCVPNGDLLMSYEDEKWEFGYKALHFAGIYSHIRSTGVFMYEQEKYNLNIKGRIITFAPKKSTYSDDTAALMVERNKKQDEIDDIQGFVSIQANTFSAYEAHLSLIRSIKKTSDTDFVYSETKKARKHFKNIISEILNKRWTYDKNYKISTYSFGDAQKVWEAINLRSQILYIACLESGTTGIGLDKLPLIDSRDGFINYLRKNSGVSRNRVTEVLDDLIFENQNSDIMHQPVVQIGNNIFVAPSLIIFSNPERNLSKLWSRKYPGAFSVYMSEYGKQKEKELASLFSAYNPSFQVVLDRPVGPKKSRITDIDVGILDKKDKSILILQLKWFLHPDSTFEVKESDEKLNLGIEQCKKTANYYKYNVDKLYGIFSELSQKPKRIFYRVLSFSSLGSSWLNHSKLVQIEKYWLVRKILVQNEKYSLTTILKQIKQRRTFYPYIHFRSIFREDYIAGYQVRTPASRIYENSDNKPSILIRVVQYVFFGFILRDNSRFWPVAKYKPMFFSENKTAPKGQS